MTGINKTQKVSQDEQKNSYSHLFHQRKKLFENFSLNEENKFKEFEEVKFSTKKDLKPLMDYFKEFTENYFKEDSDSKEFKLSEYKIISKRNSLDEYAFLKSNSSNIPDENFIMKIRANSILKALELDFHRKSFTFGKC